MAPSVMTVQVFGQRELVDHIRSGGSVMSHLVSIGNPGRGVRAAAEDATMPAPILGCDLSSKNNQLREIRFREMKEWFFNEIDDGDALLEELEPID